MPTVPNISGPQVALRPIPGAREGVDEQVNSPLEAFGGGQAARGIDVSPLAAQAKQIFEEEKQKADNTAILGAAAQLSALETSLTVKTRQRMGQDALSAPDDVAKEWQAATQQIQGSLANDTQRAAFAHYETQHWANVDSVVQHHVADQTQALGAQVVDAYIANETNATLQNGTPDRAAQATANIRAVIKDHLNKKYAGQIPEGVLDQEQRESVSKLNVAFIQQLIGNGNIATAGQYLAAHRDEIAGAQLGPLEKTIAHGEILHQAQQQRDAIISGRIPGLVAEGNVDVTDRPRVTNADGSISTVRSISIEDDSKTILIPTVSDDGRILTNDEAVAEYRRTGKHLGIFSGERAADAYARRLHEAQSALLDGVGDGKVRIGPPTEDDAMAQVYHIDEPTGQLQQETERLVRQHYADVATHASRERLDANQRISNQLDQTHDLTKIELSPDWQLITPTEKAEFRATEFKLRNPRVETDKDTWYSLLNIAKLDKASFERIDLNKYKDKLSDSDWHELALKQSNEGVQDQARAQSESKATETKAEAALQRTLTTAKSDAHFYARKVEAAQLSGNQDEVTAFGARLADANTRTRNALQAIATQKAGGAPVASSKSAARTPATAQMLKDVAAKGPHYADYLRSMGIDVPLVLPKPPQE